ncbi:MULTISPECIES: zinc finger protein [Saccharopolyspora]|uniref:Zinc-finger n=1 Tax=Saccharopolyspora gregorii TaxID=33914 RepID=A0ABP6RFU2_9PSEU|nr:MULTISPECIES: zinc finger protein [Saccharopolyspora]MCA1187807.1 hypothetical protein [Saccharopolyspora sp. 6T]MCA1193831.1 hypothetical protein [Saccharopolyspora sp. 6V]MCA1227038.1 hypothetical protein [Saccharopolyspora sp. 6M]MCA1282962.1 hypothetical protein [Saccharopolyspora sp. 7B]
MFIRLAGPVAYWRPAKGERHALSAEQRPYPGQVRDALCGLRFTINEPSDCDWFAESCADCLARAKALRDAREQG